MSFLNRHNIAMKQICGDSKDIPEQKVLEWKETFHLLIEGYHAKDGKIAMRPDCFIVHYQLSLLQNEEVNATGVKTRKSVSLFCYALI